MQVLPLAIRMSIEDSNTNLLGVHSAVGILNSSAHGFAVSVVLPHSINRGSSSCYREHVSHINSQHLGACGSPLVLFYPPDLNQGLSSTVCANTLGSHKQSNIPLIWDIDGMPGSYLYSACSGISFTVVTDSPPARRDSLTAGNTSATPA